MISSCHRLSPVKSLLLVTALFFGLSSLTNSFAEQARRDTRPQTATIIVVTPMFGGQIRGYDVDRTGSEAMLSELVNLSNGNVLAATETFSQSTGEIVSVVAKTETQDDFVTESILGKVGLRWAEKKRQQWLR